MKNNIAVPIPTGRNMSSTKEVGSLKLLKPY
jgi:hypothetical protein